MAAFIRREAYRQKHFVSMVTKLPRKGLFGADAQGQKRQMTAPIRPLAAGGLRPGAALRTARAIFDSADALP